MHIVPTLGHITYLNCESPWLHHNILSCYLLLGIRYSTSFISKNCIECIQVKVYPGTVFYLIINFCTLSIFLTGTISENCVLINALYFVPVCDVLCVCPGPWRVWCEICHGSCRYVWFWCQSTYYKVFFLC